MLMLLLLLLLQMSLANELTSLVHGAEGVQRAQASLCLLSRRRDCSSSSSSAAAENVAPVSRDLLPTHFISASDFSQVCSNTSSSSKEAGCRYTRRAAANRMYSAATAAAEMWCVSSFLQGVGPPLSRVLRGVSLSPSALEASRLLRGGAVRLNGDRITDSNYRLLLSDFKQQQQQQQEEAAPLAVLTVGKSRVAALAVREADKGGPSPNIWGALEG